MEIKKRVLTSDIVIAAAVEIAEKKGLSQLRMQELAATLNVKPASLYNHIGGIDEVRSYVAQIVLKKLEEVIRDVAVGYSREDALRKIANAYRRFVVTRPELYKAFFISSANFDDAGIEEAKMSVVRVFQQVLEPYQLSHKTKIHFTRCFRSCLHGFVSLESAGFFKDKVSIDESFDAMLESLLALLNNYALQTENRK
ncbi:MAG: TetR/AcrR family transcriptional regulator [Treponema sp.]|jgi:AcrR family transcriptional regulator|nr:TetR/AcrR family transcriptional regulator [Treponema sp.]